MNLRIPYKGNERFLWIIDILSCVEPFKAMRPKEKQVLVELLVLTNELKSIPKEQRKLLIFHQDNKKRISDTLEMSIDNYYNLVLALRKKGILDEHGIVDKYANVFLQPFDKITFNFEEIKDEE